MLVNRRNLTEKIAIIASTFAAVLVIGVLAMIVGEVFFSGLPSLSLYFISTPENATPAMGQGIANAIVGTLLISLCATAIAAPFGIGTAIYMKRYAADNKITQAFRFLLEVLSGTPSIVVGIFGFLVLVYYLKNITGGFSLLAGAFGLAILIMPVMERAFEEAINTVDLSLEEGSFALGANKWQTIHLTTIPAAFTGILTGFTLGFGRAAEESAVVILTAGYTQYMPELAIKSTEKLASGIKIYPIQDQVATLPYAVYHAFQNSNVVKPSSGFAAAFVLIVIVFTINISGKALLRRSITTGDGENSWISSMKKIFTRSQGQPATIENSGKTVSAPVESSDPTGITFDPSRTAEIPLQETISRAFPQKKEIITSDVGRQEMNAAVSSFTGAEFNENQSVKPALSLKDRIRALFSRNEKGPAPEAPRGKESAKPDLRVPKAGLRPFVRALLPFIVPLIILVLIAILAGIPPLHHILGPASPSLAGLFSTSLTLIIAVFGLSFGLFIARKRGAFRAKNHRAGLAGVAAGFCLVLVAGVVLSSAGAGLFNTGDSPVSGPTSSVTGDRNAQLAAMLASGELGDGSPVTQGSNTVTTVTATPLPASKPAAPAVIGGVPIRDALNLHEFYQYGNTGRTIRATVYDTKVLPFYFWWWIDYNRFVQSVPAPGYSYLVVYTRLENTGDKSAIVPSADQFNLTYNGVSYGHKAFFDTSVLSQWQIDYYSSHYDKLPYQWIRELGQDKRDYSFLMGYNIFYKDIPGNATAMYATPTPAPANADLIWGANSVTDMDYLNYNLKPGPSHAIDGYLIYEVPDAATKDLKNVYMQVGFNGHSGTRWRLG
jgi:phosphate transport system permease protein